MITIQKISKEVEKMKNRPGIKTTEFWLVLINIVGTLVGAFMGYLKPETVAMIGGILAGLYLIARTIVKATPSKVDDLILEKIQEAILSKFGVGDKKSERKS